jgi:GTP cyclohydrolase I
LLKRFANKGLIVINKEISDSVLSILKALKEDTSRPGLKDTPKRVSKSLTYLTNGQHLTASDVVGDAIFPCQSQGMILQKDVEFYSLCEHHLLPFFGKIHVAYLPDQKIIGLSKIGRIIDIFSRRLQVQENLTHQIAESIDQILKPRGVAVVIEAQHFCMMMRGVKKQGNLTHTSEYRKAFEHDHLLRADFLQAIK